jgi:glycerol-3-phosphate acyltransferase PlsY
VEYALSVLIGYLLGCSSMSYYISKIKNIDIKGQGSKNYGASNTVMLAGLKSGILVFIHDFSKALIAVILANWLFPNTEYAGMIAGCSAVAGHIFPFYLKFNGGKGYASFIGMAIALYPVFGSVAFIISIILALLLDYVVASTFSFILAIPILALVSSDYITATIIGATTILVFCKHHENIKNLVTRNGKEARIRKTLKKDQKGT